MFKIDSNLIIAHMCDGYNQHFKVPMARYTSQLPKENYLFIPQHGFPLDFERFDKHSNDQCKILLLGSEEIAILLRVLELLKWRWLWGLPLRSQWGPAEISKWNRIENYLSNLENALMNSCNLQDVLNGMASIEQAIRSVAFQVSSLDVALTLNLNSDNCSCGSSSCQLCSSQTVTMDETSTNP